MQVCTLLQTDNHASSPPLSFFTGRMPFLPPNQQRQSTEVTEGMMCCSGFEIPSCRRLWGTSMELNQKLSREGENCMFVDICMDNTFLQ